MANLLPARLSRSSSLFGVLVGGLLLVGCQQQGGAGAGPGGGTLLNELPSPNFSGPVAITPPAPRPVQVLPPVTPKPPVKPAPPRIATAVPPGWVPPVTPRSWQAIVVHHSATPGGGAARFDREHREKGWDELGYDFVIGNGTDTGDGVVEIGSRWVKQKVGAHAKTPDNWFNEHGIGICLVGDFDRERPTAAQMRSLTRLITFMMKQYHIPADHIVGHGDTKATDCPGRYVSIPAIRQAAGAAIATSGETGGIQARTAASELLSDIPAK